MELGDQVKLMPSSWSDSMKRKTERPYETVGHLWLLQFDIKLLIVNKPKIDSLL